VGKHYILSLYNEYAFREVVHHGNKKYYFEENQAFSQSAEAVLKGFVLDFFLKIKPYPQKEHYIFTCLTLNQN